MTFVNHSKQQKLVGRDLTIAFFMFVRFAVNQALCLKDPWMKLTSAKSSTAAHQHVIDML